MEWSNAGVLLLLAGSLFSDVKSRHISLWWLLANGLLAMGILYVGGTAFSGAAWGLLPGTLLLVIAVVSGGHIGKGDAFLTLVLGLYLGVWACFSVLMISLLISVMFGVGRKVIRHISLKKSVIFTPFLCIGFGIWWACSLI